MTAGMRHLPRREVRENVEILRPASFRRREDTCTVPEMALYVLTNVWTAVREASRWRPTSCAHFAVPTGPVALIASLFTGIPYVLTVHLGVCRAACRNKQIIFPSRWTVGLTGLASCQSGNGGKSLRRRIGVEEAYGVEPIVVPNGVRLVAASPTRIIPALAFLWLAA